MTDYDIDIRSVEPEYKHTLARQAGREVDDGREVHLSRLTVTVRLAWGSGNQRNGQTFDIVFDVDHELEDVRVKSVGDAHSEQQSFSFDRLQTAVAHATRAVEAFQSDVGLTYYTADPASMFRTAVNDADRATTHTELEVAADD